MDALGAVLVITADHGMRGKSTPEGEPQIVFMQTLLDDWLGRDASRVVLPIADPYTKHHGSLGSFALIYVLEHVHQRVADRLAETPGVTEVIAHDDACERFELPADRIGDLVVIADGDFALGTRPENHDLAELDGPLRSHGGYSEQSVPLFVNQPWGPVDGHWLRNLDAFWVGLNLNRSPRRFQTEFGDGGQEAHGSF
jgi:phosphonoacetate hydrolase